MSRWTEQLNNHAIHETLNQIQKWLAAEVSVIDSDLEAEKRRLNKAIDTIQLAVDSTDPEMFSEPLMTKLNNHLRNAAFWNQLEAYSNAPAASNLRNANEHLTQQIPIVFQLLQPASEDHDRSSIGKIEDAYDQFCSTIEKREKQFAANLAKYTARIDELSSATTSLQREIKSLKEATEKSLSGWQSEFTEAQTSRAQEFSDDQIDRSTKFDEELRAVRTKSDTEIEEITTKHEEKLNAAYETFKDDAVTRQKDMTDKHNAILEIHGLVGTDGVAGGYQKGAEDEHKAANTWRIVAMVSLAFAAGWVLLKYLNGFASISEAGVNWSEVITATSLTLVLLAGAGYASRQSKLHRDAEQQLRWFALEVKAIDPFISSLDETDRKELKKSLTEKLFGKNRTTSGQGDTHMNPKAYKDMSDAFLSPMREIIKLLGKQ